MMVDEGFVAALVFLSWHCMEYFPLPNRMGLRKNQIPDLMGKTVTQVCEAFGEG